MPMLRRELLARQNTHRRGPGHHLSRAVQFTNSYDALTLDVYIAPEVQIYSNG